MQAQERYQALKEAFLGARDLDEKARAAHLDRVCGGDPSLRQEVERLLAAHDAGEHIFLTPPKAAEPRETEAAYQTVNLGATSGPALKSASFPGYTIVRQLSRGGQGVVFQAIQESTKRKVAIKVLLEGPYASAVMRRRFEREIELVAQLRHPNIISVFHSGATADGHQYLVMDYVRGVPLNEYVRERKLTLEAALELFASVCEAVQYAHQRGIIHRDLKPSNIIVDVEGNPKILDFGLAKRLGATAEPLATMSQQVLGTLPYMSPEQTRGNPDEIDTRTDVYSLGVVLYELLTGQYPYPVAGEMAEVLKHIAETEATPPSRRWTADSGITGRSAKRLRASQCPIDDEVQTIVLKCLSKERERRYQSGAGLVEDIRRYLKSEPIRARPTSLAYQLRMFARRNRVTVSAAAVVFVALTAGFCVATWQAVRARGEAEKARAIANFLCGTLNATNPFRELYWPEGRFRSSIAISPDQAPGGLTVIALLDQAVEDLEGKFSDQPLIEAELRMVIGRAYLGQSRFRAADTQFREALHLRRQELGDDHPDTMECVADLSWRRDPNPDIEALQRSALAAAPRVWGPEDRRTLALRHRHAMSLRFAGELAAAEAECVALISLERRALGEGDLLTLLTMNELASLLAVQGKTAEAEHVARAALEIASRIRGVDDLMAHVSNNQLAAILNGQTTQKTVEAESLARQALAGFRRHLGNGHWYTLNAAGNLFQALIALGRVDEADALALEACVPLQDDAAVSLPDAVDEHRWRREFIERVIQVYDSWDAVDPDKRYDAKAGEWRAKLEQWQPTTLPVDNENDPSGS